jgi:hypothetical protein
MLPEAKGEALLYVSYSSQGVLVFSYKSHAQVGQLTGFTDPYGQCVDASGDVWITDFQGHAVDEYAHGSSTPLKQLAAHLDGGPVGCSISPNGDLAVSLDQNLRPDDNDRRPKSTAGGVLVFKNASGTPTSYVNSHCNDPGSPGYDNKGNLYLSGIAFRGFTGFKGFICELPAGASALRVVSFKTQNGHKRIRVDGEGSIMWDGKHVTVTLNADQTTLAQTAEADSGDLTATRIITLLDSNCGANEFRQVFLVGKRNTPVNNQQATEAVAGNQFPNCTTDFNGFEYPASGNQTWTLNIPFAFGESVSIVPKT